MKLRTLNKAGRKGGSNKAIKNTFSETLNKSFQMLEASFGLCCGDSFHICFRWDIGVKLGVLSRASWITKSQFRRFPLFNFDTISFRFLLSTAWRAAAAANFSIKLVIVVFVGRYKKVSSSSTKRRFDARVVTTYLLSSLVGRASRVIKKGIFL